MNKDNLLDDLTSNPFELQPELKQAEIKKQTIEVLEQQPLSPEKREKINQIQHYKEGKIVLSDITKILKEGE